MCQIDLEKPPIGGLGISLVTAETENQTGVFIRTISPGGVAHNDGRLRVGNKVLQVGYTIKPVLSDHIKQDMFLTF